MPLVSFNIITETFCHCTSVAQRSSSMIMNFLSLYNFLITLLYYSTEFIWLNKVSNLWGILGVYMGYEAAIEYRMSLKWN